jgi:hypothetical protein
VEKLIKVIKGLNIHVNLQDILEFIYIVKAWQNLSNKNGIANELSFESFYNQKIDSKKLSSIFDKLSKEYNLFKLYRFDTKVFDNDTLIDLLRVINSTDKLPSVNESFYSNKDKNSGFSVSSQVAQLGIKLLDCNSDEIYVPFTNGFAYVEHTNKIIYADNEFLKAEFYAELINILEDKKLILIYKDNGCGISPEIQKKIYDPFFTTNRENGGSGLGMNIVYNLVTVELGGVISLESELDKGIKFTIIIKG